MNIRHFSTLIFYRWLCNATLLSSPRFWFLLAIFAVGAGCLRIAEIAFRASPTDLEPSLIVSGLSHLEFGRFELFSVNPPLVRTIAALPVYLAGYSMEWDRVVLSPSTRPEFAAASIFTELNGVRTSHLISLARSTTLAYFILGATCCFYWARQIGKSALGGFVAILLWCTDPTIFGHSALATNDIAVASFCLISSFSFAKWVRNGTRSQALLCGMATGVSINCKFSALLLLVSYALSFVILTCFSVIPLMTRGRAVGIAIILVGCSIVVNAGYLFQRTFVPLGEYSFVSSLFNVSDQPVGNRFAESILGRLPVPFPEQMLFGLDKQNRDFESYSHDSYLRGYWKHGGWWYYYIYAFCVKIPIFHLILIGFSILYACWVNPFFKARIYFTSNSVDVVILAIFIAVYSMVLSSQLEFNTHFRYSLPVFGPLFVIVGSLFGSFQKTKLAQICALSLFLLGITRILGCSEPISFFNILAGGNENGYRHLLGSSFDWGQDAKNVCLALQERNINGRDVDSSFYHYTHWDSITKFNSEQRKAKWYLVDAETITKNELLHAYVRRKPFSRLTVTAWILSSEEMYRNHLFEHLSLKSQK